MGDLTMLDQISAKDQFNIHAAIAVANTELEAYFTAIRDIASSDFLASDEDLQWVMRLRDKAEGAELVKSILARELTLEAMIALLDEENKLRYSGVHTANYYRALDEALAGIRRRTGVAP